MTKRLAWREQALFLGILGGVQLGLVAFFMSGIWSELGMPLDDSWIHLSFARNLAENGVLGLNDGEWSGGTTSLLWNVLLAMGYRLSGQMLGTAYLAGAGTYWLAGGALYLLLAAAFEQTVWGRGLALAGAVGFATIGQILFLALSGMETHLFLALALWCLVAFVHGRYGWAGWLLAALSITRIEGMGLVLVLGLVAFVGWVRPRRETRQRWRPLLLIACPPALTFGLYLLLNWSVTGHLVPTTLAGRKWLYGLPNEWLLFRISRVRGFLQSWGRHIAYRVLPEGGWGAWMIVGGLGLVGLVDTLRRAMKREPRSNGLVLLLVWALVHNLIYLLLFPHAGARYQVPNLVALPVLVAAGAHALVCAFQDRHRRWGAVLAGVGIVACMLPGCAVYKQMLAGNVRHINRVHVAAGQWVDAHLSSDALVAAFDVGAVRYAGNRRTLDLGGLVDAEYASEYMFPGRVGDYLYEQGATHLVMPEPTLANQMDIGKRLGLATSASSAYMRFQPLKEWEVPPYTFAALPRTSYPAYLRIVVYEIQYLDR